MRYVPKPSDNRAQRLMWVLIAAGAVCFCLTPLFPAGRAAFQLGACCLLCAGLYIGVRYVMTEFTYEITLKSTADPADTAAVFASGAHDVSELPAGMLDLVVRKKNSRRGAVMDACLDLGDLRYFAPLPREGGREREPYKKYPAMQVYVYTVSIVPAAQYMAVFVDEAHNAIGIVIEPDAAMIERLERALIENGAVDA